MAIALEQKQSLVDDIRLLNGGDPAIKPISAGLSSIEQVFNKVTSIIKNQILLDRFEHKEELRIQKEIAAEGGSFESDDFSGTIPILDEMVTAVETMIGAVLEGNKKRASLFQKAITTAATALAGLYIADQMGIMDVVPNFDKFIPEYFREPKAETDQETPIAEPSVDVGTPDLSRQTQGTSGVVGGSRKIPGSNAPSVPQQHKDITSTPKQIAKGVITNPIGAAMGVGAAAWRGVQNTIKPHVASRGVTGSTAEAPKGSKATWMSTIYSEYRRLGLTDEGAKTMVAHINRENSFQEKYLFGIHTDAHNNATNVGMMSWQKDRGAALLKYLKANGLIDKNGKMIKSQEALKVQVQFSVNEINSGRYEKTRRALTDPKLKYSQIEAIVGDDYVRWRRKDPKYRKSGYERQNKGYDQISAIISDNTSSNAHQFASNMMNMIPSFGKASNSFIIPVSHPLRVTSQFGKRNIAHGSKNHRGMDIGASVPGRAGDPILAANDGLVKVAENRGGSTGIGVYIDHQNGYESRYMHLQSTNVKAGQYVKKGQMIGKMGKTGTKVVHLHFEILKDGKQINPSKLLPNSSSNGSKLAEQSVQNKKKKQVAVVAPASSQATPVMVANKSEKKSMGPAPGSTDRYRAYFS